MFGMLTGIILWHKRTVVVSQCVDSQFIGYICGISIAVRLIIIGIIVIVVAVIILVVVVVVIRIV